MSTQGLNGTGAVDSDQVDPLEAHASDLEAMLPALTAQRAQVEAHLKDLTDREERIKAGISVLRGKKKTTTVHAPPTPKAKAAADWKQATPSPKLCDDVYAAIATASEPPTIVELADLVDKSRSAVDNTVRYLRRIERVRVVGVRKDEGGKRAGNVFGVMA